MFGYVKINKDEMKFKDFYVYKGVYCSLCRVLGDNYGFLARMTLNYDCTFVALMLLSMDDWDADFEDARCPYNPLVKCKKCRLKNINIEFSAAAAMMMLYYKLIDNVGDEGFFKKNISKFLLFSFKKRYNKAKDSFPMLSRIVEKMGLEQTQMESEKPSIDQCANPSATALATIVSLGGKDDTEREILYRIGYCVGRYVYFMDAYDDYEKDKKRGSFNPFIVNDNFEIATDVISQSAGEAVSAFYLLTPRRYKDVLQNIIEKGLTNSLHLLQEKHKKGR